jgi:hypothetical protein
VVDGLRRQREQQPFEREREQRKLVGESLPELKELSLIEQAHSHIRRQPTHSTLRALEAHRTFIRGRLGM